MKICIYADPHWSRYSSILKNRKDKYSVRLDNLIQSVNWVQELAKNNHCDKILCLGDFFDRNNLLAEEIDALKEIKWANIPQTFLVGNHEIVSTSDSYSSTQLFTSMGFEVIGKNCIEITDDTLIAYIPYSTEENRESLSDCFDRVYNHYEYSFLPNKKIIFSHNDIKGIQYGKYESKIGYDLTEIEDNCDLFINGHLHNAGVLNDKGTIINLGNLTGQNFNEDGFNYQHYACILDTETLQLDYYVNPYAIYFYKITIEDENDIYKLNSLNKNSVVEIRVIEHLINKVKEVLKNLDNIITYRTIVFASKNKQQEDTAQTNSFSIDYLDRLNDFCIDNIGNYDILKQELTEICR